MSKLRLFTTTHSGVDYKSFILVQKEGNRILNGKDEIGHGSTRMDLGQKHDHSGKPIGEVSQGPTGEQVGDSRCQARRWIDT